MLVSGSQQMPQVVSEDPGTAAKLISNKHDIKPEQERPGSGAGSCL